MPKVWWALRVTSRLFKRSGDIQTLRTCLSTRGRAWLQMRIFLQAPQYRLTAGPRESGKSASQKKAVAVIVRMRAALSSRMTRSLVLLWPFRKLTRISSWRRRTITAQSRYDVPLYRGDIITNSSYVDSIHIRIYQTKISHRNRTRSKRKSQAERRVFGDNRAVTGYHEMYRITPTSKQLEVSIGKSLRDSCEVTMLRMTGYDCSVQNGERNIMCQMRETPRQYHADSNGKAKYAGCCRERNHRNSLGSLP